MSRYNLSFFQQDLFTRLLLILFKILNDYDCVMKIIDKFSKIVIFIFNKSI